jgi:hypothetical protein
MSQETDPRNIYAKLLALKELAVELYQLSSEFPSVNRNTKRILASIHIIRINLEECCSDDELGPPVEFEMDSKFSL